MLLDLNTLKPNSTIGCFFHKNINIIKYILCSCLTSYCRQNTQFNDTMFFQQLEAG